MKMKPKYLARTQLLSVSTMSVPPSVASSYFTAGLKTCLTGMQSRFLLTVSFGCVTIVSIYFNKLPEGLFCCLETTYQCDA